MPQARPTTRTRCVAGLAALLLALLVSQWLGLLHAVNHAPRAATGAALVVGAGTAAAAPSDPSTALPLAPAVAGTAESAGPLLHHHSSQAACQLFDHLLMGHVPSAPPASPPCPAAPQRVLAALPCAMPPATALVAYDARGPPRA